ncbi:hypothetical protein GPECTOR_88g472 [Gonium pectorale]|uniref:Uncharacterized protein n=1 Tax=Gonium pectorale TaxID=33097 RepID=A0A150G0Z7_GONPE|nr:hypothetical protein GPECTOR_88g472 [Gonium pectorale]|eukprot:KXZ43529.1 hypothetical protein GPECTOR_88g472 [Gonium pectorale]
MEARDFSNRAPLYEASREGHVWVAEELLAAGADVEAKQWDGETPLGVAARGGHVEVIKALLLAGADKDAGTTVS